MAEGQIADHSRVSSNGKTLGHELAPSSWLASAIGGIKCISRRVSVDSWDADPTDADPTEPDEVQAQLVLIGRSA